MRTVWVTGASSGLGLAVAQAFAAHGWLVIAGARSFEDEADKKAEAGRLLRFKLDVTSDESCAQFANKALALSGRVDALVCGAAILVLGSCENTTLEETLRVMDTNYAGALRMVRLALASYADSDTRDGCTHWEITEHLAPNSVQAQANNSQYAVSCSPNSQLKCLTERIRFFALTKLSAVRRTGSTLNGTRQSQDGKDGARIGLF